ncbi:50S ribosomal protein L32e [Candidatus Bathyarchaeota archaeon]|nr:50S ribosomal protein L32e [Candidatus Bathyarchaeota archaeon]
MASKKRSTPRFVRQESWRYIRVKGGWRRPRGKTSKMRLGMRGWPKTVKVGYKSGLKNRGLHPSGLEEILVRRPADLEKINAKTQIVKIAHSVGERKRIAIMERAEALELTVANPGVKKAEAAAPEAELIVKEPEETKTEEEGKPE